MTVQPKLLGALTGCCLLASTLSCQIPNRGPQAAPAPRVAHFEGLELEKGRSYRSNLVWDEELESWWPEEGLRVPFHHSAGIEWTNLDAFEPFSTAKRVLATFTVVDVEIQQRASRREWVTSYTCEISKAAVP